MPGRVPPRPEVQPAEVPAAWPPPECLLEERPPEEYPPPEWPPPPPCCATAGERRQITHSKIVKHCGDRTRAAIRVVMALPRQGM